MSPDALRLDTLRIKPIRVNVTCCLFRAASTGIVIVTQGGKHSHDPVLTWTVAFMLQEAYGSVQDMWCKPLVAEPCSFLKASLRDYI